MTDAAQAPDRSERPNAPMERNAPVVYFEISLSQYGASAQIDPSLYQIDADKDRTRMHASLMKSAELARLTYLAGQIRQYGYRHTMKGPYKRGVFLLPAALIPTVQADMEAYLAEWEAATEAFIARYDELVEADKAALREAFNPRRYPGKEALRARFSLSWSYREAGVQGQVPAVLQSVSAALYASEQRKVQTAWEEVLEEARQTLWAELVESVKWMGDKLSGATDRRGRAQKLSDDFAARFEEFLGLFSALNITNDEGLEGLAERARQIMAGMPETAALKKAPEAKAALQAQFQALQADAERYIVAKPRRAFVEDDD